MRGGGTLHHMAPELVSNYINKAAGRSTVSYDGFACDMWALGVMLIQLLTGRLPFWPKSGFDYLSMQALLAQWVGLLDRLDLRYTFPWVGLWTITDSNNGCSVMYALYQYLCHRQVCLIAPQASCMFVSMQRLGHILWYMLDACVSTGGSARI